MLSTRSSWTATSIPQNVGWQFIGHIVLMRRLSLIDSPSAKTRCSYRSSRFLARRRNPADDAGATSDPRRRLEDDDFSLVGNGSDQWLDCESMGHEHERSRPPPGGHDLLELAEPRTVRIAIGEECPGALHVAHGHQRSRVHTAAHGRGKNLVHSHAVAPEGVAQRLALGAPLVVEVPLRLAVVDPEARRITTVAGRRIPVANQ